MTVAARRVMGIDPGLAVTGYGVVDGDGHEATAVATGVLRTRTRDARAQRLASLFEQLCALMDEHRPDEVGLEQHFVAQNVRSAMVIGEARAAAMIAAASRGLPVFEYPATTIKQAVAGYGGAPKEQVQAMVAMQLRPGASGADASGLPLDASDALAVALTRLAEVRMEAMLAQPSELARPSPSTPLPSPRGPHPPAPSPPLGARGRRGVRSSS